MRTFHKGILCCSYSSSISIQRRSIFNAPEVHQSVRRFLNPKPVTLPPAQVAFKYRIGMEDIPAKDFRLSLSHPVFVPSIQLGALSKFNALRDMGREILELLATDYVSTRFPKLPKDSAKMAVRVYTSDASLYTLLKDIGMDYAVLKFEGIPNYKMVNIDIMLARFKERFPKTAISPSAAYADTFAAMMGTLFTHKGLGAVRTFMDAYIFSGTFNKDLLCRPKNPMLKLAYAVRKFSMPEPDYRLLHETGRLSTNPTYVVGVYVGLDKLSEANGPSLLLARERAAVQALRKLFLTEDLTTPRKSDELVNNPNASKDLDQVRSFFNREEK